MESSFNVIDFSYCLEHFLLFASIFSLYFGAFLPLFASFSHAIRAKHMQTVALRLHWTSFGLFLAFFPLFSFSLFFSFGPTTTDCL